MGREPGRGGWRALVPDPRSSYSLRLAAFYGALFAVYGVHLPYLPVWLDVRGLTAEEIAAITAAPYFLRVLITPAVALWADASGRHRPLINGLAWLALLLAALFTQMQSFWPIFLLAVPFAIALSSIVPLTETLAVSGARAHALDYGRMRLWGSITFVAAGFAGGWLIDHAGTGAVAGCILASMAATVACAWTLPERIGGHAPPRRAGGEPFPADGEGPTGGVLETSPPNLPLNPAGKASHLHEARKLVASPLFLTFLIAAGCAQAAHGMFYAFGALHWHAQGISTAWVGVLWAIAIVGEVALFAYSDHAVQRWGPTTLLIAATAASIARWVLMSLSPPLPALIPLQTLHTLTYGASHLGAMHFIARAVPDGAQGTAQALYATVASGVLMGAATLSSGWLYARVDVHAYLAMAALAAVGFAAALIVRARWTGGLLWDDGNSR